MTTNLALEFDGNTTLTSANTNLSTSVTPSATQVLSVGTDIGPASSFATNDDKAKMRAWVTDPISGNVATAEADCWCKTTGYEDMCSQWLSRSTRGVREDDTGMSTSVKTGENQKLGTYYNWYAATAGTSATVTNTVAPSDICPKGWQLPRKLDNGSYAGLIMDTYQLIVNTGAQDTVTDGNPAAAAILRKEPLSIPYSGYVTLPASGNAFQGTRSQFWTAQANNVSAATILRLRSTQNYVGPIDGNLRTQGNSIRCIAK